MGVLDWFEIVLLLASLAEGAVPINKSKKDNNSQVSSRKVCRVHYG